MLNYSKRTKKQLLMILII